MSRCTLDSERPAHVWGQRSSARLRAASFDTLPSRSLEPQAGEGGSPYTYMSLQCGTFQVRACVSQNPFCELSAFESGDKIRVKAHARLFVRVLFPGIFRIGLLCLASIPCARSACRFPCTHLASRRRHPSRVPCSVFVRRLRVPSSCVLFVFRLRNPRRPSSRARRI